MASKTINGSINSTLLYTQLMSFKENDHQVKVANKVKDACELVKTGFQYVTGKYSDGKKSLETQSRTLPKTLQNVWGITGGIAGI